jgi:phage/plasmid-like protein (TIGR03299 family)
MPAYFEQGFSVRQPMWHGLGEVLAEYPGREEAMRLAGHDFSVTEVPVFLKNEDRGTFPKAAGFKGLVNSKTGELFNVARDSYTVVQNDVPWDILDAIVDQPNVRYETAGTLKGGAVCWALAWLDEPTTIKGDDSPIYPYGVVSWAHDGSGAIQARATSIRVVCWNTLSASEAQSKRSGRHFTFRHTKNVMARIDEAKRALSGIREEHEAFIELANELAAMPVTDAQREQFVERFIPAPVGQVVSDRVLDNISTARAHVRSVFNSPTMPEAHRNTAYGLVQAGVEYLDHLRGVRNSDTYMGRTLLRDEALKKSLVPMVRELVGAGA